MKKIFDVLAIGCCICTTGVGWRLKDMGWSIDATLAVVALGGLCSLIIGYMVADVIYPPRGDA